MSAPDINAESTSTGAPPGAGEDRAGQAASPIAPNALGSARARRGPRASLDENVAIPEEVKAQFKADGSRYWFPDGTLAFTDLGRTLTTPSENREVIRAFVTIAAARGWEAVEIRGTERFKHEAWAQAQARGLAVFGYQPPVEAREVIGDAAASAPNRSERETGTGPETEAGTEAKIRPATRSADEPLVGQLVERGAARYLHQPGNDASYFVTVDTGRGRRTVWGVDLERALRESQTQPEIGEAVELRQTGRRPVTVKTLAHNPAGDSVPTTKVTHRNGWQVEKAGFWAERAAAAAALRDDRLPAPAAVAQHPDLLGSEIYLKVAQDLVSRSALSKEDQARFVAGVREAMATHIEQGAPWLQAQLREPVRQPARSQDRGRERT